MAVLLAVLLFGFSLMALGRWRHWSGIESSIQSGIQAVSERYPGLLQPLFPLKIVILSETKDLLFLLPLHLMLRGLGSHRPITNDLEENRP